MRLFVVCALAAAAAGCASKAAVSFVSLPAGAEVITSSGLGCPATPCVVEVPRKEAFTAAFRKEGYREAQVPVLTRMSDQGKAGLAVSLLAGGVGGALGYGMSGAGLEHVPNPVSVELEPLRPAPAAPRRKRPAGEPVS